jgi:hypothetical protein
MPANTWHRHSRWVRGVGVGGEGVKGEGVLEMVEADCITTLPNSLQKPVRQGATVQEEKNELQGKACSWFGCITPLSASASHHIIFQAI